MGAGTRENSRVSPQSNRAVEKSRSEGERKERRGKGGTAQAKKSTMCGKGFRAAHPCDMIYRENIFLDWVKTQ